MTRVLALDYGSARCGCAISDPSGTLATPIDAIAEPASEAGAGGDRRAGRLASEVEQVVVGLPVGLSGEEGSQAAETRAFADRLAALIDGAGLDL